MWSYRSPACLPDGHSQTLVPALLAPHLFAPHWRFCRTRWTTPDGDFIDVDRHSSPQDDSNAPLLVVFHGLEGSSSSHYAQAFAQFAWDHQCACAIPHFRGCSGALNHAPRAYHSGDFEEIDWILRRFKAENPSRPLWVVGISLGGNALMKWAGEFGASAHTVVDAVASVCAPLDLAAAGRTMGQGFNRHVYTRMFLRSMVPKAFQKLKQHPGLFDAHALKAARTLYEFDAIFTAPLHGYLSTEDYWLRASAQPVLADIRIPALILNAKNDPFIPASSLPEAAHLSAHVCLWQPAHGGHVGFPSVHWKKSSTALWMEMPTAVGTWLMTSHLG
jgi:uncharacterized protein